MLTKMQIYAPIHSEIEYEQIVAETDATLIYFSHDACNVCKVLKPKIAELVSENYPKMKLFYVDLHTSPEISSQKSVFVAPTLIVYFAGREYIRKSRNLGIDELSEEIARTYGRMFE
jgi:thiol-disulfide isomerase/thioredoxin